MNASPTIYDEDVRLQPTTTATPAECECGNLCCYVTHPSEEMLTAATPPTKVTAFRHHDPISPRRFGEAMAQKKKGRKE